jgi:hypothetical protein
MYIKLLIYNRFEDDAVRTVNAIQISDRGQHVTISTLLGLKDIWYAKPHHAICQINADALLNPEVRRIADLDVLEYINR